jgi:hypothetical protein
MKRTLAIILFFPIFLNLIGQDLGIVLHDSIIVKNDPNPNDSIGIFKLYRKDLVKIIEIVEPKQDTSIMPCGWITWIKIKVNSKIGWVDGEYIYAINTNNNLIDKNVNRTIKFFDKTCRIGLLRNFTPPPAVNGDMYYCDQYYPLIFYSIDFKDIYLIPMVSSPNSDFYYCNLRDDGGAKEIINNIISGNNSVLIKVSVIYQDGSGNYDLIIYKDSNGDYKSKVLNLKTKEG